MSEAVSAERRALAAALRGDAGARRGALERIAALPPDEVLPLVDAEVAAALAATLGSERRSEQRAAADVLAGLLPLSPALREAVRAALRAPAARLRWGAAYTLGRGLGATRELWPAARETMMLEDGDQRWAAAELACAIARRDEEVADDIRDALEAQLPTLRKMALYCLRDLGTADAAQLAHRLLRDANAGVRLAALSCVLRAPAGSELAHAAAATLASLLTDDPDLGVRRAAAATLGRLGVASMLVIEALDRAARSPDPSLARAATGARRALASA